MRTLCPLCGSERIHRSGNIFYQGPVSFSTHDVVLECIPELWKCKTCTSSFTQNILPEDKAAELYATGASNERWSRLPFPERKPANVVKALSEIFTEDLSVLDVGCNTGELLDFAKSRGCVTYGIEPSISCQNILKEKGHKYFASLENTSGNRFDIITAFDIIEHLYDIHLFMRTCTERLKETGVLVICTGDISSLSARIAGSNWWYTKYIEHIVFPSTIFFRDYSGLVIKKRLRTYAAKGYRQPVHRILSGFVKGILNSNYSGLPSLGADHVLLVLGVQ